MADEPIALTAAVASVEAAPAPMPLPDAPGAAGTAHHQGFNFDALNNSHNFPAPAVEWVHGYRPLLVLNVVDYAERNLETLSAKPAFATAEPTPAYQEWANDVVYRHGGEPAHAERLAKAMTVAADESVLGTFPRALSFFNHQTFWSTIALILAALVLLVFARRRPSQVKPQGRVQHLLEALVLFVRDSIVRPNIHHHPDSWTPFFASLFIAIMAMNLFGLIPLFGTATGNIAVTTGFALFTGVLMLAMGIKENGPLTFFVRIVPVPWSWNPFAMILWIFLFVIEVLQLVIRPAALSIRLFANMLAGHIVLLVFGTIGFIIVAASADKIGMGTAMGIAGWFLTVAFYAFELLIALLQAFIFTLLSAVFIGLCAHPKH